MAKKETFPPLKLTFRVLNMISTFVKRALIIGLAGSVAIVIFFSFTVTGKCSIKQIDVLNDMKKYEVTKNPELCNEINNRIIQLNNQCGIEMEILDCG
jgi:hypothetical protein